MLEKIFFGIAIGVVARVVHGLCKKNSTIWRVVLGVVVLVAIIFIAGSLAYSVVFGIMAAGEITFGYWAINTMLGDVDTESSTAESDAERSRRERAIKLAKLNAELREIEAKNNVNNHHKDLMAKSATKSDAEIAEYLRKEREARWDELRNQFKGQGDK